jgi:hypothetical protein
MGATGGRLDSHLSKSSKDRKNALKFDAEIVAAKVKAAPVVAAPEPSKYRVALATLGPVLASAFSAAAIMYPLDLIR